MRFMVIVKGSEDSEKGVLPTEQELTEMGAYNEELVKAGVMLAGEGLLPSSKGARVRFDKDGSSTVVDGPFAETKELVAGFWILEVSSREEVLEWVRKAPFRDGEVEVRQVATADDFGDAMTPELREQEDRLRATSEAQHGA
ncbi:YciI family protein [Blastococcus sp. CT_GayMR19]|uniref:YciI family protein n=1 Tax=Blastococcus sp. CT_GayMR19 TaxID=2559608 RepID=UPI00107485E8|nr:YciI family protein [Blastococcus sp. CT_GayMR19]TFV74352.1 YciI family protein [Blastococcus sp. CT_GayMR19]